MQMQRFNAINPKTGLPLKGTFTDASTDAIDQAVQEAHNAFPTYRKKSGAERATFLEQCAQEIEALGDTLLKRCQEETALPLGRLQGELGRTTNQLRLFAQVLREGSWVGACIDTALPKRQPIPRPDIRQMQIPLGPVVIFGASNFPLAFSTAGGDTASALAAGCPVIVKAHPAHPGTAALVGQAMQRAADKTGMPKGSFSLVQGISNSVGAALVTHPLIKAVGFTGSFAGGKALFDLANNRPEPIPVFAEMGSTNPVFILPRALAESGAAIAAGLTKSVTLGSGQFCTNPGLTFIGRDEGNSSFMQSLQKNLEETEAQVMLTSKIQKVYEQGTNRLEKKSGLSVLASGKNSTDPNTTAAKFYTTTVSDFLKDKDLEVENFGPSSIVVETDSKQDMLQVAKRLEGHLTATVHGTVKDLEENRELLEVLEQKVGRILLNGYPTGVEVCHAMVHGGPYPATTAPQTTSVGTKAISRFVRPICFQNYSATLLPPALQDDNPLQIWRLIDGKFTKDPIA